MRHRVTVGVVVAGLLLGSAGAQGQQAGGWVGQRVVTTPGTVLKNGRKARNDDRRAADRAAGPTPFEEVQDEVRRLVRRQKVERASSALLEALRRQMVVTTIFDKEVGANAEH